MCCKKKIFITDLLMIFPIHSYGVNRIALVRNELIYLYEIRGNIHDKLADITVYQCTDGDEKIVPFGEIVL
jgi:hypothetical protein